jgi:hypothetical protein
MKGDDLDIVKPFFYMEKRSENLKTNLDKDFN